MFVLLKVTVSVCSSPKLARKWPGSNTCLKLQHPMLAVPHTVNLYLSFHQFVHPKPCLPVLLSFGMGQTVCPGWKKCLHFYSRVSAMSGSIIRVFPVYIATNICSRAWLPTSRWWNLCHRECSILLPCGSQLFQPYCLQPLNISLLVHIMHSIHVFQPGLSWFSKGLWSPLQNHFAVGLWSSSQNHFA